MIIDDDEGQIDVGVNEVHIDVGGLVLAAVRS